MTLFIKWVIYELLFTILPQFPTEDTNSLQEKENSAEKNQLIQQKQWEMGVCWEMKYWLNFYTMFWLMAYVFLPFWIYAFPSLSLGSKICIFLFKMHFKKQYTQWQGISKYIVSRGCID